MAPDERFPVAHATVYDVETYPNYVLFAFREPDARVREFEATPEKPLDVDALRCYLNGRLLVGFNSNRFDDFLLDAALAGRSCDGLYVLGQQIISEHQLPDKAHKFKYPKNPSIDLRQVLGGDTAGSLKLIAGRMGSSRIEELPFDPSRMLGPDQVDKLTDYCRNDLAVTAEIYHQLLGALEVRQHLSERYNIDLRSRSDASMAEAVLCAKYQKRTGIDKKHMKRMVLQPTSAKYVPPAWASKIQNLDTLAWLHSLRQPIAIQADGRLEQAGAQREIFIAGKAYTTGVGGLHSVSLPCIMGSDDVVAITEADVMSNYPAIIVQRDLHPAHLTRVYTEIVKELMEQRVAAKKRGDKTTADSLKIVINSIFGKAGSPSSVLYDPQMMLAVTLTGQLALLWLIEELANAGFTILSANTDGITVRHLRSLEDQLQRVFKAWEDLTGLNLETSRYRVLAQRDVNNFIAIGEDGRVKTKGAFLTERQLNKNVSAPIIAKAVVAHIRDGSAIADTVNASEDIRDFCYIYKSNTPAACGDHPVGKVCRWYRSRAETCPLTTTNKQGKRNKLPNSDRAALALTLPDAIPEDLDRTLYIEAANALLFTLDPGLRGERNAEAHALRQRGFSPYPMKRSSNVKGVAKTRVFNRNFDFSDIPNIATQTGIKAGGLIAFDLDHPERVPHVVKAILKANPSTTCWEDPEAGPEAVWEGRAKGKVFYRISDGQWWGKPKSGRETEPFGIEWFFGHPVTIEGPYPKDPAWRYRLSEHPIASLPEDLTEWFVEHAYPGEKPLSSEEQAERPGEAVEDARLERVVSAVPELAGLQYVASKRGYRGCCPAKHREAKPDELLVWIAEQDCKRHVACHCVHATCDAILRIRRALETAWQSLPEEIAVDVEHIEIPPADTPQAATIAEALRADCKLELIMAPMGSGKSVEAGRYFLELLKDEDCYPVFVTATKDAMSQQLRMIRDADAALAQTVEEQADEGVAKAAEAGKAAYPDEDALIAKALNVAQLWNEAGVLAGDGGDDEETEPAASKGLRLADHRGVLTHFHYVRRKGVSEYFFPLWDQLGEIGESKKVVVIIDEIDAFLRSLVQVIPFDSRYLTTAIAGASKPAVAAIEDCPARQTTASRCCLHCDLRSDTLAGRVDRYGSAILQHPKHPDAFGNLTPLDIRLPDLRAGDPYGYGPFEWQETEQHPGYLRTVEGRARRPDHEIDFKAGLGDLIQCSWHPRVFRQFTMDYGRPGSPPRSVSSAELKKRCVNENGKAQKPAGTYSYPKRTCEVTRLVLPDLAPLQLLKEIPHKVVTMTGTMSPVLEEMLREVWPDVKVTRLPETHLKIERVVVLELRARLSFGPSTLINFAEGRYGKALLFVARMEEAEALFASTREPGIALYASNNTIVDAGYAGRERSLLITYPYSSLGRGINLPDFDVAICDVKCIDPTLTAMGPFPKEGLESHVEALLKRERDQRVAQALSRILRPRREETGTRVLVLHNPRVVEFQPHLRHEDLSDLVNQFRARAGTFVHKAYYSSKVLLDAIASALLGQDLPPEDTQRLSKRKRGEARKQNGAERWAVRKREAIAKVWDSHADGAAWREANRKTNLSRYLSKEEREQLKAEFEAKPRNA